MTVSLFTFNRAAILSLGMADSSRGFLRRGSEPALPALARQSQERLSALPNQARPGAHAHTIGYKLINPGLGQGLGQGRSCLS